MDISGEEIHELLNELDTNHNGQVEVEEYLQVRGASPAFWTLRVSGSHLLFGLCARVSTAFWDSACVCFSLGTIFFNPHLIFQFQINLFWDPNFLDSSSIL